MMCRFGIERERERKGKRKRKKRKGKTKGERKIERTERTDGLTENHKRTIEGALSSRAGNSKH